MAVIQFTTREKAITIFLVLFLVLLIPIALTGICGGFTQSVIELQREGGYYTELSQDINDQYFPNPSLSPDQIVISGEHLISYPFLSTPIDPAKVYVLQRSYFTFAHVSHNFRFPWELRFRVTDK